MNLIAVNVGKARLAVLWFGAAAVLFLIVLLQCVFGHYGDDMQSAWTWFLPSVLPTLSLIAGVFVAESGSADAQRSVSRIVFHLAYGISLFYLASILLTLLLQPFATAPGGALGFLKLSNFWLAPLQGLATAGLGAFFVKREKT